MIPLLYDMQERKFENLGMGFLNDLSSCKVTEERNGQYELELTCHIDSKSASMIDGQMIILAKPSQNTNPQPFRVYEIDKSNGEFKALARHISYDMTKITVMPAGRSFSSVNTYLSYIQTARLLATGCPYYFSISVENDSKKFKPLGTPLALKDILLGVEGSLLDCCGGDWEFNGYTAILKDSRGKDSGAVIRYGKNLIELGYKLNTQDIIAHVVPYYIKDEKAVYSPVIVRSYDADEVDLSEYMPFNYTMPLDVSSLLEEEINALGSSTGAPAPLSLDTDGKIEAYVKANYGVSSWLDIDNFTVKYVDLAKTLEYKDYAILERINLCDTVEILHEQMGIKASAKVIQTVYDVLNERYDSITLGKPKATILSTIKKYIDGNNLKTTMY